MYRQKSGIISLKTMGNIDITIIGAGVIGLAIAARLSEQSQNVLILEKESSFGQGISSRNSEVIHAGIYYPRQSLKAKLCVEGTRLLYEICKNHNLNHKKLGKLIVATAENEIAPLEKLLKNGQSNGVLDLEIIDNLAIKKLEPKVSAKAAIYSPNTGIIDTHGLMKYFAQVSKRNGAILAFQSEVTKIAQKNRGYEIQINQGQDIFTTRFVINCAGLDSVKTSNLAGINGYKIYYAKGNYFYYNAKALINRLVYPLPEQFLSGLGIHAALDLGSRMKFGPDVTYVEELDYAVDISRRQIFYESVKKYLPDIELDKMEPDLAGIRPKLQSPADPEVKDFIIQDEVDKGFPNFINLIGIESPGLTASPAIANYVFNLIKENL